jgi:hypothetical protein
LVRRKSLHRRALMLIQRAAGTVYAQDAFGPDRLGDPRVASFACQDACGCEAGICRRDD